MFKQEFLERLSREVERVEEVSSVELVVVVSQQCGNYREIDHQTGFLSAIAMLLVAIYSPWDFHPEMLLLWLVSGYGIGLLVSSKIAGVRRIFTSPARRRFQAQLCARGAFVEKKMSSTRDRTGLLLYISEFERLALLLADTGIEAKVPRAYLNEFEARCSKASSSAELESEILKGLDGLLAPLGQALPRAEDDENELPNEICVVAGGVA